MSKEMKEIDELIKTFKIKRDELWYNHVYEAARILKMSEQELAQCGLALFLTHGTGHIKQEGRVELHKKIDQVIFNIEAPAE